MAWGSCIKFWNDQDLSVLNTISEKKPDCFIWLGDFAYFDSPYHESELDDKKIKEHENKYREIFSWTKKDPFYMKFKNDIKKQYAVWDDHDYGIDNGDKYYEFKEINKKLWLESMGEHPDSPRWSRDGLYDSHYLDDSKMIKLVMLDLRYNRMSLTESKISYYFTGAFQDQLGDNQWKWLEEEISEFNGMYLVIGSST